MAAEGVRFEGERSRAAVLGEGGRRPGFGPSVQSVSALLALLIWVAPAMSKSGGPPNGVAGNPPNFLDCSMCHFTYPANSGFGSVEILGLPETFEPGAIYELEVLVQDPDQIRWGFEMTVLDDADPLLQGGQLEVVNDERTQISLDSEGEVDYLKHTLLGTDYLADEGRWAARWTAPGPDVESITFYVAGNAADGNFDFTNDFIYTSSYQIEQIQVTPTLPSTWGRLKETFRSFE